MVGYFKLYSDSYLSTAIYGYCLLLAVLVLMMILNVGLQGGPKQFVYPRSIGVRSSGVAPSTTSPSYTGLRTQDSVGDTNSESHAHSMAPGSIFGLVALCMILFVCVPVVLYFVLYRRNVERRRREASHAVEVENIHLSRVEEAGEFEVPRWNGVDVVIYSDEDGNAEPHRPRYNDTSTLYSPHAEPDLPDDEPEKVQGVAIRARLRPLHRLPRGKVVVKHESRRIEIQFREDAEVPEAEPPPLSKEEREKLEAELRRVASPIAYGRAAYNPANPSSSSGAGVVPVFLSASNLPSRNNSPIAFSVGPSPAASLKGSFSSQCRFRRETSSRGGVPPRNVSPSGSIGGADFSRQPSRQRVMDSSDDDELPVPEHHPELNHHNLERNAAGVNHALSGSPHRRLPLSLQLPQSTSPSQRPRYASKPLSSSLNSEHTFLHGSFCAEPQRERRVSPMHGEQPLPSPAPQAERSSVKPSRSSGSEPTAPPYSPLVQGDIK